jgi:NADPH:quinone reductase-like Zn-dependent oxidoreductase
MSGNPMVVRRSAKRYKSQPTSAATPTLSLSSSTLAVWSGVVVVAALLLGMLSKQPPESSTGLRVVVTGASSGVGEQLVYQYASRNASLFVTARRAALLDRIAANATAKGALKVTTFVADFSDAARGARVIEQAVRELGGIDVLVRAQPVMVRKAAASTSE